VYSFYLKTYLKAKREIMNTHEYALRGKERNPGNLNSLEFQDFLGFPDSLGFRRIPKDSLGFLGSLSANRTKVFCFRNCSQNTQQKCSVLGIVSKTEHLCSVLWKTPKES
jgi:hypothetical protein